MVIPAFNEGRRLERALPQLTGVIDESSTEILLVDDGSRDGTARIAASLLSEFPHHRVISLPVNAGKGGATRVGVSHARGRRVVFMDADMATDPGDLAVLLGALESNDVAIGSRSHPDSVVMGASGTRVAMGRTFNAVVRMAGGVSSRDTQCGFKGFRGPAAKVLFHLSRSNGFAFDVELLLLADKLGLRRSEVPVRWTAVPDSTVRPLRDPLPMVGDVLRSRVRWRGTRPLAAIHAPTAPDEAGEAARELRNHLRLVDPVVPWEGGAVAFLPCTDRSQVTGVARRLRRRLPDWKFEVAEVPARRLVPRQGGPLRSALAA